MSAILPLDLVTPAVCADRLGVHRSTVTRWVQRGLIPAWRICGTIRLDWDAVVRLAKAETASKTATDSKEVPSALS